MHLFERLLQYADTLMNNYDPCSTNDTPVVLYDYLITNTTYDEDETYERPIVYETESKIALLLESLVNDLITASISSEQLLLKIEQLTTYWVELSRDINLTGEEELSPPLGLANLLDIIVNRLLMYYEIDKQNIESWFTRVEVEHLVVDKSVRPIIENKFETYTRLEPNPEQVKSFTDTVLSLYCMGLILLDPQYADWLSSSWLGRAIRRYLYATIPTAIEYYIEDHYDELEPLSDKERLEQFQTVIHNLIQSEFIPALHGIPTSKVDRLRDLLYFNNEVSYAKLQVIVSGKGSADIYLEDIWLLEFDIDKLTIYIRRRMLNDSDFASCLAEYVLDVAENIAEQQGLKLWENYTKQNT